MDGMDEKIRMTISKRLFNLGGPAGAGKDEVVRSILTTYPNLVARFPRSTTRRSRDGEQDGIDYFFLTEKEFLSRQHHGLIIGLDLYAGYLYGIDCEKLVNYLVSKDKTIIMVGGICGVQLKSDFSAMTNIYLVCSEEQLRQRLKLRGGDPDYAERCTFEAMERLEEERQLFDVIINNPDGKLQETVRAVTKIMKLPKNK